MSRFRLVVPPAPPIRSEIYDAELTKFGMNDEQRLLRYILREYDNSVRPVFNASTVVQVYMGLTLTHIFNIVGGVDGEIRYASLVYLIG